MLNHNNSAEEQTDQEKVIDQHLQICVSLITFHVILQRITRSGQLKRKNSPMPKTLESPEPVKKEPVLSPSVDSEDYKDTEPMSYAEKLQLSSNIRLLPGLYIFPLLSLFVSFFIYLSQVTF